MSASRQKTIHDRYAATVALLLLAFVVSPLALVVLKPVGNVANWGAFAFSLLCGGVAWTQWKWRSAATIPSIIESPGLTK